MKIDLFLENKLMHFILPEEINGSFSFDEDPLEESKLINIEERDNSWVLYSTTDSKIIGNNTIVDSVKIEANNFYILRKKGKNYLIYVGYLTNNFLEIYRYDKNINMSIGNSTNNNIILNNNLLNNINIKIHYLNGQLIIEKNNNTYVYINDFIMSGNSSILNIGDIVNIFELKILFTKDILIMYYSSKENIKIIETPSIEQVKLNNYYERPVNIEINR